MTSPAPEHSPLVYVQHETLVALVGEPLALSGGSRLVIAKWDGLYAEALRTACVVAFEGTPVEVCRTGDALLKSLRARSAEIVLMGLTFPDKDGVDVMETLARERLAVRVLLVSGRRDEHSLQALRTARFDGFVDPLTEDFDGVVGALRAVAAGRGYISASLQRSLLGRQPLGPLGQWLTPAEHQVFCVIGDGSDNAEAAERLGLSEATVLTHRRAIMRKLGVHSSAKLVLEAVRFGVVRVAPDGRIFRPGFERIIADQKARRAARRKTSLVHDAG